MMLTKAAHLSEEMFNGAIGSWQYRVLLERIAKSGECIISLEVWGLTLRQDGSVLFVHVTLETTAKPGFKEVIMLTGDSLTVLIRVSTESGQYAVFVRQYRGAQGGYVYELPAGMEDAAKKIKGKPFDEVLQETGIVLDKKELVKIGKPAMVSPGRLDERMQIYFADIRRSEAYVHALQGYRGGLPGEYEETRVVVVPWQKKILFAWAGEDLKFLAAYGQFMVHQF